MLPKGTRCLDCIQNHNPEYTYSKHTKEKPTEFQCCFKPICHQLFSQPNINFTYKQERFYVHIRHATGNVPPRNPSPLHNVNTWNGKAKLQGRDFSSYYFSGFLCKQQPLRGSAVFHVISIFWVPCLSTSLKMPWVCMKMKGLWISINPSPTANLIIF